MNKSGITNYPDTNAGISLMDIPIGLPVTGWLCLVCFDHATIDWQGKWCKRCFEESTMSSIDYESGLTVVDLIKKYRPKNDK